MKGNMRELLVLGECQGGKSTAFNAICDGREISLRGVGVRTTGCPISVQSIPADEKEYAELVWKTDDELMLAMYDIVSDNLWDDKDGCALFPDEMPRKLPSLADVHVRALAQKAIHSECERYRADVTGYDRDDTDKFNRLLIATLILKSYERRLKLKELRGKTKVAPDDVKSLAAYPRDWFFRWQKEGEGTYWSLKKVQFAFLSKVVCHVHSPTLERLGCVVTDCPCPLAGPLEAEFARKAMEKADAILYVLDGSKQLGEAGMRDISLMCKMGLAQKLVFAINARWSEENAENVLRPMDFVRLKDRGVPIEREEDILVFNALLAFNAKTTPSDSFAWRKTTCSALSMYLELDPFDDDDRKRAEDLCQDKAELYRASGLETVLDEALERMSAAACAPGRHLEIALIGEYQNGKSTIFNAMLGGRDLSPRGVNVKRSACTITACAISPNHEECAEFEWRSDAMLDEIVAVGRDSDGVGGEDVARLAKLISRFRNSPELARLRKRGTMPIKEAQSFLVYPEDWEPRWRQDETGEAFEFAQIAWVFIGRVKYHVHSRLLGSLGCDLTDSPGFGAGEWDETLARAAILRADVLVCVLDKSKAMTSESPYVKRLRWTREVGKDNSIVYALNSEKSRETAGEWQKENVSTLAANGFEVDEWQAPVLNAELGRYAAKMRSANDDASMKNVLKNACHIMGKWLEAGSEDRAMVKELCRAPRRMSREAGFDGFLDAVRRAVSDFRTKERDGRLNASPIHVRDDGAPVIENGFAWNDDSSFVSRLMKGCRWKAGIPHDTCPHVVSAEKERVWRPAAGYAWVDDRTNETRWEKGVKWTAGLSHPTAPHVVSGRKEGIWHPEPGYAYVNGRRDDLRVKWKPGLKYPVCPNVVSSGKPGTWNPKPGYAWVDETSWTTKLGKGVKWKAGLEHPKVPHVKSACKEGFWTPVPGYKWRQSPNDINRRATAEIGEGVEWRSLEWHPHIPHVYASREEGIWRTCPGYVFSESGSLESRCPCGKREWKSGEELRPYGIPHVYASYVEGVWTTHSGYVFSKSGSRESRNPYDTVEWQPGQERYDGKVAGYEEGHWVNKWWWWH